jgi:cell division protein FtsN
MAQTDYVSRGQKRNKKTPKKAPTPWFRITLAVAFVGVFAFALYYLQKTPADDASTLPPAEKNIGNGQAANQQQSAAKEANADIEFAEPSLDIEPLPKLGEEEWAFIDALPEYSVEVDIPDVEASDRQYIMQCGSFRTTERAQELRAILAMQGMEAQMLQSDGQNGRWYRVVMGPYERKRAAERDRHHLRRSNINGCKIY